MASRLHLWKILPLLPPQNIQNPKTKFFSYRAICLVTRKKYEELAGQMINEGGKELGRATLAINTGDKVFCFFFVLIFLIFMYNEWFLRIRHLSLRGCFATYHFSLLEATYRVKQQDKLIEWDTNDDTQDTQSSERRANNCKGIVKESINPVY